MTDRKISQLPTAWSHGSSSSGFQKPQKMHLINREDWRSVGVNIMEDLALHPLTCSSRWWETWCEGCLVWRLFDVKVPWCEGCLVWRFLGVKVVWCEGSWCEGSLVWRLFGVKVVWCEGCLVWRFLVWRFLGLKVPWCEGCLVRRCEGHEGSMSEALSFSTVCAPPFSLINTMTLTGIESLWLCEADGWWYKLWTVVPFLS